MSVGNALDCNCIFQDDPYKAPEQHAPYCPVYKRISTIREEAIKMPENNLLDKDRQMIVETEATVLDIDHIRLKFHGLPGDTGPDLIMDPSMARIIIQQLSKCLPENYKQEDLKDKILAMLRGVTLSKDDAYELTETIKIATEV